MSDQNDSGDKTEKPTSKRLNDARKKGDVPKSRDVTQVAGLVVCLAVGTLATGYAVDRIAALCAALFTTVGQGWTATGFACAARALAAQAAETTLLLVSIVLVPAAAVGVLSDFLQTGPVLSFEKVLPKLDALNPVEGVKRMFTLDKLVELLKMALKTALLGLVGWLVISAAVPQIVGLARSPTLPPATVGAVLGALTLRLLAWTVALFALVALLDAGYQRHAFTKKMRMSIQDIKREMKESEGDPHIKQQRRQAHQEWSQRNAAQAARNANVLVVNPTHVAIAIDYDRETTPIPSIAAKGEDHVARAMRAAAEEAGVPIVRNVSLARDLLARAEVGEIIPADLFEIIAEVILWAREVREHVAEVPTGTGMPAGPNPSPPRPRRRIEAPGEDLTHYPEPSSWDRSL
jgi:type III secretion protein U